LHRLAHELTAGEPSNGLPPNLPISRHAQFVWFSDFLSPPEAIEAAARRLSGAGASGHLIQIIDPAEEDFPFEGRTRFEVPGERETELFGRAESVREGYRARFRAHGEAIAALGRRLGWTYLAHRTDKSPNLALIALYATLGGEAAQRIA
jgi:uncharacterized protein (DUF58 family)